MNTIAIKYRVQKGDFCLDVDTLIPDGGVTGVFGESGSGKTTLLRCIAGLEPSSRDAMAVHKRQVGYVFQEPQLFSHLSVRKNIEYGYRRSSSATVSPEEVSELLEISDLLDRSTSGLSAGEAQRVSIARVLCQSPRLILMDEPLSALDERRRNDVLPYLDRLHCEWSVPIVYVSHDIDEICRLSDHLLVLAEGQIIAAGGLQETLSRVDLPIFGGRNAGRVIEAMAASYDNEFNLTLFEFSGGGLWAPGYFDSKSVRLRIDASDVSLSRVAAEASSITNILAAEIVAVDAENRSTCLVTVRIGDNRLLARITRRSLHRLNLQVGDNVFAQIKSVTVRC